MGGVGGRQTLSRAGEIQLDHLRRTRSHKEQLLDIRTARQQPCNLAIQFVIGICHARQIGFFEDCCAKTGFSKNHHSRGRLQKMRAGAAADNEEKRILHFTVKPDDAGEAAEYLALSALF